MLRQATLRKCCPTRPKGCPTPTGVLFGLEGEFRVLSVRRIGPTAVKMIIEQIVREGPCPVCGVLSSVAKDRPLMRVKDLPACGQIVELWWRKRRLRCGERLDPRRSFTQTAAAVRQRGRLTERLRDKLATAIAGVTGRSPMSLPSTACRGRPPTGRWSPPRPGGCPSLSRGPCWVSTRPGSAPSAGFSTGSPGDAPTRG
jgi:hypothetical protein